LHAGIRQTLALLSDIEIPSRAPVRHPGDDLPQVMHAAQCIPIGSETLRFMVEGQGGAINNYDIEIICVSVASVARS
jgi:hypothetical protein